jgi:hypothetical protein
MRPSWNHDDLRAKEQEIRAAAERRRLEEARRDDTAGPVSSPRRPAPR